MSEEEKKAIEYVKAQKGIFYKTVIEIIDRQQKEIESNKQMIDELNFRYNIEHSKNLSKKELVEQQQKEIEELKDKNKTLESLLQGNLYELYLCYKEICNDYQANCISKDKIREILDEYKKTDTNNISKIIEFYQKIKKLLEE